jgi:RIO kinase 2
MREREYTADREHVSWQYTARKAAEREFDALETLYPDVSVPQPVGHNRHAIVMERMEGAELSKAELDSGQAVGVLDLILREAQTAFDAGYVHADLSEYNVFVDTDGVTIFDWPQAVPTDHENAAELLERDVQNIVSYFQRKYPSRVDDLDIDAIRDAILDDEFDSVRAFSTA